MRSSGSDYAFDGNERHGRTIGRLAHYLWPKGAPGLRLRVVFAMLFLVGAKTVSVITPFFYKEAVDRLDLNEPGLIAVPIAVIVAYGSARLMSIIFSELRDITFVRVSQHALRQIALSTFRHMHSLSLRFHLDRQTGGLSRAIERGTRAIDFILRFMLFSIIPTIIELVLVAGIFYTHFGTSYLLLLLLAVVSYVILTFVVTDWRLKFRRELNKQDSAANTKAIDSLLNYETVKYFGNEDHEAMRYDYALERYQRAAVKSQLSLSILNAAQALIINSGLVVVMVMAARGFLAGDLTLGDFVLANTLLMQLFIPLGFLGFVYREIKQSLVDMEAMFSLIDQDREVHDKPGAAVLNVRGGKIEFRDVNFHYDPARPILKNVNFEVQAGKTVAIVGPSGAGKSTISRILFRFYDISAGSVLIDGQDIRDVTQASLRESIGIVPQDAVLFNDSIRYNIEYGRPGADMESIRAAASLAHIDAFVNGLPEGYDTAVGERGLKLSGGEKQRVAIARTIIKDPPILLFDEATSALDTATERDIQASLKSIAEDRTTLIIAHRLSTIIDSDEILVIENGEIVERGRHEDLLVQPGVYAAMWSRQQEAAETVERLKVLEAQD